MWTVCPEQFYSEISFIVINLLLITYQLTNKDKDVQIATMFLRIPFAIILTLVLEIVLLSFQILFFLPLCVFLTVVTGLLGLYLHKYIALKYQIIQLAIFLIDIICLLLYLFPLFKCSYVFQESIDPAFTSPVILFVLISINMPTIVIINHGFDFFRCSGCSKSKDFFLMDTPKTPYYGTLGTSSNIDNSVL